MIYPWIFVSFVLLSSTQLILTEVNLPTQKDVTEALETVGKFLKDDGGPNWLASLVTKQSAPLTTDDLMKEILNSTQANESVKQAANIIKLALDEQKQTGSNKSIVFEFDGWKDMIDNVEKEDDILCLYRKSYNRHDERSEDWQKFLSNISPNYTIYFAFDMGQKYVICLKKINIPERNNTSQNSDKDNDTPSVIDSSMGNSSATDDNEASSGSRSMSHVHRLTNNHNDKCDSSDGKTKNDNSRSMPANMNFGRRTWPMPNAVNSEPPCNRPIIFMLPPNYMPSANGYNMATWPRYGHQMGSDFSRSSPSTPYYQPRYIPYMRPPPPPPPPRSPLTYPYLIDKHRHAFDYGRKQLPVSPRPPQHQESNDEINRMKLNQFNKNIMRNSADIPPANLGQGAQFDRAYHPPPYRQTVPSIPPLARSLSHPWTTVRPQFDPIYRQPNFVFSPFPIVSQPGYMRSRFPHTSLLPVSPLSSKKNCTPCMNPCDRPILLKVSVESPPNQPVKVGLINNGDEIGNGRRQMSDKIGEREMGSLNEKTGDTVEESANKEIV